MTDITTDLPRLALLAAAVLVSGGLVTIEHHPDWRRPAGWPLRRQLGHSTSHSALCSYRPIDVLRYVDAEIKRPAKAAAARARAEERRRAQATKAML